MRIVAHHHRLAYRDLKPAAGGTCALEDTELEGRYGRLLSDLRANSTEALGRQALAALHDLNRQSDALEATLTATFPDFGEAERVRRGWQDMQAQLAPG